MKAKGNVSSKSGEVWSNYFWVEDQWELCCSERLASACVPVISCGSEIPSHCFPFASCVIKYLLKLLWQLCLKKMYPKSGKFLPVLNLCPVLLDWLLHVFWAKFCSFIWCLELFTLISVETQMGSIATVYKRFLVLCLQVPAGVEYQWNFQARLDEAQIIWELCG